MNSKIKPESLTLNEVIPPLKSKIAEEYKKLAVEKRNVERTLFDREIELNHIKNSLNVGVGQILRATMHYVHSKQGEKEGEVWFTANLTNMNVEEGDPSAPCVVTIEGQWYEKYWKLASLYESLKLKNEDFENDAKKLSDEISIKDEMIRSLEERVKAQEAEIAALKAGSQG